jgi:hypothetical protein
MSNSNDTHECRDRHERRGLKPGVYGPLPTFFDDNQELDLVSYKKHLLSELSYTNIVKRGS